MTFSKKFLIGIAFTLLYVALPAPVAATLSLVKDTISTSRPSASAPLTGDLAVGSTQATFTDNGTRFIASDSAKLTGGTGTLEVVTISSMSAAAKPSPGNRIAYFTAYTANQHNTGTVIMTPVTAKHTISFATTSLPSGGHVIIVLSAGDTSNPASPSASGFSFNSLVAGNIGVTGISVTTCAPTPATGTIDCTLSSAFGGGAATVTIGSTTPALINPTKTVTAGTADTWVMTLRTTDNNSIQLDQQKARIATIDSVEVYATVDPSISMTIAGKNTGAAINVGNTTGCTNTELVNTGINSSATDVNMGVLTPATINIGAQLITITTNAFGGYALTATTSGHLLDPSSGYWINDAQNTPTNNDTPVPVFLTAGTTAFGIHPCGLDVTAQWATGATGGGAGAKYANPASTFYYTLASDSTGPVDPAMAAGNGLTTVEYAATVSGIVPAGSYLTAFTYVATPSF